MRSHMIESLERREFLSAVPAAAIHHGSSAQAVHAAFHHSQKARASRVPSSIIGLYGGAYAIYPSQGNMDLTVTSIRGNSFFGNIQFAGYDGASFSASVRATMTRNNNFRITVRGSGTAFAGTGTYSADGNINLLLRFNRAGRIDGQRMNRYVLGEAALVYGQDAFNYFG